MHNDVRNKRDVNGINVLRGVCCCLALVFFNLSFFFGYGYFLLYFSLRLNYLTVLDMWQFIFSWFESIS